MNRKQILEDTIKYYSEDTNRRCVSSYVCFYNPIKAGKKGISEGCAIGRLISEELQIKLDDTIGAGVANPEVFKLLPEEVQTLGQGFLIDLQKLHDADSHWDSKGLTKEGERKVTEIKEKHEIQ